MNLASRYCLYLSRQHTNLGLLYSAVIYSIRGDATLELTVLRLRTQVLNPTASVSGMLGLELRQSLDSAPP